MKHLFFLFVIACCFASCLKSTPAVEPDRILSYMSFVNIQRIDSAHVGDTVTAMIRVTGPNQCYRFEGFEGKQSGTNMFDIAAVGSIPNPAKGDTSCDQTMYVKDTVFRIYPKISGPLIIRYYNLSTLFMTDTININQR